MRTIMTAVFTGCLALHAAATTLVPTDVAEMSREARAIALGRVVTMEARWSADRRRIETLVTLQTEAYLKGSLGGSLRFLLPGGELGRFRSIVVGAPQLAVGQDIVVFLGARDPGVPFILGFNQGLFRVAASNGVRVVKPAGPALRLEGEQAVMPLEQFARRVRTLAGGGR
jgi:hypothetical protein